VKIVGETDGAGAGAQPDAAIAAFRFDARIVGVAA
jgi:hypothetical protein